VEKVTSFGFEGGFIAAVDDGDLSFGGDLHSIGPLTPVRDDWNTAPETRA
jgi:hypothetical protein